MTSGCENPRRKRRDRLPPVPSAPKSDRESGHAGAGSFVVIKATVPAGHVLRDSGIGVWTDREDQADTWD